MWVWLKLKLTPKGHFCVVSVTMTFFVIKFLYAQPIVIPESANTVTFRSKHPRETKSIIYSYPRQFYTAVIPWILNGFLYSLEVCLVSLELPRVESFWWLYRPIRNC